MQPNDPRVVVLFGQLFKRIVELPGFNGQGGGSYIGFLTPGVVVMTALFSTGWSGMSYITDLDRGVLDRFLVSPARRAALVLGQLGYMAAMTVLQSLLILGLGLAAGARFHGGPAVVAVFLLCTLLLGTAFAAYSNTLALLLRKQESLIGLVNFVVLPLAFLSSTFMPGNLAPSWIRHAAAFNPVNWAVEAGRQTLQTHVDWALVLSHTGYLAVLACVAAALSIRAFRAYQRSV